MHFLLIGIVCKNSAINKCSLIFPIIDPKKKRKETRVLNKIITEVYKIPDENITHSNNMLWLLNRVSKTKNKSSVWF